MVCIGDALLELFGNYSMIDNPRIVIDSQLCHGVPCIRGLRYPVSMILELLASGMSHQEILADYEDFEEDDLRSCLQYAARITDVKSVARIVPRGGL